MSKKPNNVRHSWPAATATLTSSRACARRYGYFNSEIVHED